MIDGCEDDGGDGAGEAGDGAETAAGLSPAGGVVLDAQADAGEEVVALVEGRGTAPEGVAQPFLDDAHDPSRASIASMPRRRWVFTELREMPSVSAMSSMPCSS